MVEDSMQDDFDFRPYLRVVARNLHWLLLAAFLAAAAAVIWSTTRPTVYSAQATVLVRVAQTKLMLEPRFDTSEVLDAATRRQALVDLARSPEIETYLSEETQASVTGGSYIPGGIAAKISATSNGELIVITASDQTADQAAALANAWADAYVRFANTIFTGREHADTLQTDTALRRAEARYNEAQTGIEQFYASTPLDQLRQRVAAAGAVVSSTYQIDVTRYEDHLRLARSLELVLQDARALQSELADGEPAGVNERLAALLLRARAVAGPTPGFDFRLDPVLAEGQGNAPQINLSTFINALETQIDETRKLAADIGSAAVTNEPASGNNPLAQQRSTYLTELTEARGLLEQETAKLHRLELERDVALEGLQVILRKELEAEMLANHGEDLVSLAGHAVAPRAPIARPVVRYSLAAGIAALLLATAGVLVTQFVRQPPVMSLYQPSDRDSHVRSKSSG